MMEKERMEMLMEITGNIRDEFIEDGALPIRRHWGRRIAAAAAMLILLIGGFLLLSPKEQTESTLPFFVIKARAANGAVEKIGQSGDVLTLETNVSELFPNQKTYMLDISLEEYRMNTNGSDTLSFHFRHNGNELTPGMKDGEISIEWLSEGEDGPSGYRIIGWCEETDYIDIVIRDEDGQVIHRTKLNILYTAGYQALIEIAYTYRSDMSTDELIDELLKQNYSWDMMLASSDVAAYSFLLNHNGGFAELEERTDAASELLERYVYIQEGKSLYGSSDWIVGLLLSRNVYWNQMTQAEREQFASYGKWRSLEDEGQVSLFDRYFPDKHIFEYSFLYDQTKYRNCELEIAYNGKTTDFRDEHFFVFSSYNTAEQRAGWCISGWFEEPTEVTITASDANGSIVRRDVILITPAGDDYQIEILETTE